MPYIITFAFIVASFIGWMFYRLSDNARALRELERMREMRREQTPWGNVVELHPEMRWPPKGGDAGRARAATDTQTHTVHDLSPHGGAPL